MQSLPTRSSAKGNTFTVADFYEAGREALSLTLVAGAEKPEPEDRGTIVKPSRPGAHGLLRALRLGSAADFSQREMTYLRFRLTT